MTLPNRPFPNTVWYSVEDTQILSRITVLKTVTFPDHGRYILYKQIDWPDEFLGHPSCLHEATFLSLFTPMDPATCEIPQAENFISKISSPPPLSWSTVAQKLWRLVTLKPNNYW